MSLRFKNEKRVFSQEEKLLLLPVVPKVFPKRDYFSYKAEVFLKKCEFETALDYIAVANVLNSYYKGRLWKNKRMVYYYMELDIYIKQERYDTAAKLLAELESFETKHKMRFDITSFYRSVICFHLGDYEGALRAVEHFDDTPWVIAGRAYYHTQWIAMLREKVAVK